MAFRVRVAEEAAETLRTLPPRTKRALRAALARLAEDPTGVETDLDIAELDTEGVPPRMFRLRLGDSRAAFQVVGRDVQVIRVSHRREGYLWMEDAERPE